ncbi:MAG: FMN-binding protein [Pseudomonadales bacterium]|nr:FMN-binding protein [Pseudomonadales bacterium]
MLLALLSLFIGDAWAKEKPEDLTVFLAQVFGEPPRKPKMKYLSDIERERISDILSHSLSFRRVRYWRKSASSVWLLEEVGKHKPITAGFWLEKGIIKKVKVLAFRESRGWEIKYPYFLKQFNGVFLLENTVLSTKVDGISGATLSVRAMTKMARIALYLNQQVTLPQAPQI